MCFLQQVSPDVRENVDPQQLKLSHYNPHLNKVKKFVLLAVMYVVFHQIDLKINFNKIQIYENNSL